MFLLLLLGLSVIGLIVEIVSILGLAILAKLLEEGCADKVCREMQDTSACCALGKANIPENEIIYNG